MRHTARKHGLIVGATAVVVALAGCAAPAPATSDSALAIGVTADPDSLLPWTAAKFQATNVLQNVYGTLTEFDSDLNVVPGLATAWEVSADGRTVTFTLGTGVKFADGSDFDSADAVYSLKAIQDEATAAIASSSLSSVVSITAPDSGTLVLTLDAPDSALFANLASTSLAMLSSDDKLDDLKDSTNGTGPFELSSWVPNQALTLVPNPEYSGTPPKLSSIEFRVMPEESSIVAAMRSGNIDMMVTGDPLVARTADAGTLTVTATPQLNYHVLQLNARRDVVSDQNVRLAIQCAVDRQQVLDTAALGEGQITGPITSPAFQSDASDQPCPTRDLDKSKDYLTAAGVRGPITIDTIVSQGTYSTAVDEAQNLKAQLADAGIDLNLEILESGAYEQRWIDGDFDAAVALNGGKADPDGMYGRYFTSTGNLNAVAGFSSPKLDTLFAEGRATVDQEKRRSIYTSISEELSDQAAWVWLFTANDYTIVTKRVSGFEPMSNGSLQTLRSTSVSN